MQDSIELRMKMQPREFLHHTIGAGIEAYRRFSTSEPLPPHIDAMLDDLGALKRYIDEDGSFGGDICVLHSIPEISLLGIVDAYGRPIRERRALPHMLLDVEFELRKCPYHDSREGHEKPMNVAALRHMSQSWKDMLAFVDFVRTLHLQRLGKEHVDAATAFLIADSFDRLPWFLSRRVHHRFKNRDLPPLSAATYKLFIGAIAVIHDMCVDEMFEGMAEEETTPMTGQLIFERSNMRVGDDDPVLIGPVEVCAGPPNMIVEGMQTMMSGLGDKKPAADAPVYGEIRRMLPAIDDWLLYQYSATNIRMLKLPQALNRYLAIHDMKRIAMADSTLNSRVQSGIPDMGESPRGDALMEHDDEDRGTANEIIADNFIPAKDHWSSDLTQRNVEKMGAAWKADRGALARRLVELWRRSDIGGRDETLQRMADRVVLLLENERLTAEAVARAESNVRQALGRDDTTVNVSERLVQLSCGTVLPDMLQDAFGMTRGHEGADIVLEHGSGRLVFDEPLCGPRD